MATEIQAVRRRKASGLITILTSAACEWFLILLLFMGAVFSYMLRKFARYCELEAPCPLCSILDSVFEKKKPGSYWSLVCSFHKEEISSLVSCFSLFDVYGICEECLMSNSESRFKLGSLESRTCLCCNKKDKCSGERLGTFRANSNPRRLRCRGSLKGLRGKFTTRKGPKRTGGYSVDTSCRLGYSNPKLSSDSESEFPFSEDDDDGGSVVSSSGNSYVKPELDVGFPQANNVVLNELKNEHCLRELSSAELGKNLVISEKHNRGPCENVAETSSNDACSSNSNSKNLTDSLGQISENMEFSCEVCSISLLKRNGSSNESLDVISVDNIENESVVDRLKRQVERDRTCIKSLLNELEEERNAAAVAANETMAMITRLQDEKAALRLEALQYLRMVEETANGLLAEREREMEEMEYELEYYRNNESGLLEELGMETTAVLEEEKLDISQCMKELERKVARCCGNVDEKAKGLNWKNENWASNGSPKSVRSSLESSMLQSGNEGLRCVRDLA